MKATNYVHDVFISFAVEDRAVATELWEKLTTKGLKVWYSGKELKVGDALTEAIHNNLELSRFGVVVLSPTYLSKIWTLNEFFFLQKRENAGTKTLLPVLYKITPEELASKFPPMANIFAIHADRGIDIGVDKLLGEISRLRDLDRKQSSPWGRIVRNRKIILSAIFIMAIIVAMFATTSLLTVNPPAAMIEQTVQKRIELLQQKTDHDLNAMIETSNGKVATADKIKNIYSEYMNTKSYYRNEYILQTGYSVIRARRNVEAALATDISKISPFNLYTFTSPHIYKLDSTPDRSKRREQYLFYNTQPVTYQIGKATLEAGEHKVSVTYKNPMRMVYTTLTFPFSNTGIKYHQTDITALRPAEIYTFTQENDEWILKTVE
jgi:hypothetical protein